MADFDERSTRTLALRTGAITLLGVLPGGGFTVGTAVQDRRSVRVLADEIATGAGRGPLGLGEPARRRWRA